MRREYLEILEESQDIVSIEKYKKLYKNTYIYEWKLQVGKQE